MLVQNFYQKKLFKVNFETKIFIYSIWFIV